jgi:hypothetical protein
MGKLTPEIRVRRRIYYFGFHEDMNRLINCDEIGGSNFMQILWKNNTKLLK